MASRNTIQNTIQDTVQDTIFTDGVAAVEFLSFWKTDNPGTSNNDQITLPLIAAGTYNFLVDWGDSTSDTITVFNQAEVTHTYAVIDSYDVTITGIIDGFRFDNSGDEEKLLVISMWGPLILGTLGAYFSGCVELKIIATDILDTSGCTDMSEAFSGCSNLTTVPNMGQWDMSNILDFSNMFLNAVIFDENIGSWDTSSSTNMAQMFANANIFNQNIGSWELSIVTNLTGIFLNATLFNQDIGSWNVGLVTSFANVFSGAAAFNQDIDGWNVSSSTNMVSTFDGATVFNQPLTSWTVSSVTSMTSMFQDAVAFDQDITSWNVALVSLASNMFNGAVLFNQAIGVWTTTSFTNINSMFSGATAFNQNIDAWDVSSVTLFGSVFLNATAFNQPLNSWTVTSGTTMVSMFNGATAFNQPLGAWVPSSVDAMASMFEGATAFNQAINAWNVTAVTNMNDMFNGATLFDQDVSGWNVINLTTAMMMFNASAFQITNYDLLLVAWDALALQANTVFDAGTAMFSSGAPATAKANMISSDLWTITDGGELPFEPDQIADLELWLDAADTATITSAADFVSQWDDKSGNNFDVTQTTGSAQPMTNQTTLNSLNVITTDGNDTMLIPSGLNFVAAGPNTRFVLCRRASEDATNDNITSITQGGPARVSLQYSSTSGRISFVHNVSNALLFSNGNTNTNFQVIMGRRDGTTQALAVDGGTEVSNTNASDVTGITDRDLFALNQISSFLTGDMAEMLVYSRSLSSGEITQIIDYFTDKWAIP